MQRAPTWWIVCATSTRELPCIAAPQRTRRFDGVVVTATVRLSKAREGQVMFRSSHFVFKKQYDVSGTGGTFFDQEITAIDAIAKDFAESVVTSILEGF